MVKSCLYAEIHIKMIKCITVMKLFIDDLSKEKVEQNRHIKLINKMIISKLLTNMMGYLHAKFEPKILKNKGALKLSIRSQNFAR